jgi:NitT/TauT family transport system permease protein
MLRGLTGALVLFVALEALTRAELVSPTYLPPASAVVATTLRILVDLEFLAAVGGTLAAWALGLLLASAIAVPLGLLLGWSWRGYLASTTAIELLRPIPSVALIPLAILLLGRGLDMRVALVAYASLWPILLNTIYGVRDVDPVARDTARAFGFGTLATLRRVSLPSAAPFIYTGIRIAAAIALIVAISAELVAGGSTAGIGVWMLERTQPGITRELMYAAIVVTGLLGLGIDVLMVAGERRLFGWHQRLRRAA